MLKALCEILGNDRLHADTILTIQEVVSTVTLIIHVMCPNKAPYFGVLIHPLQFLPLWVTIIL